MISTEFDNFNKNLLDSYDCSRFKTAIDCVMPGYFSGNDVLFVAQNPGLLKQNVEGDMNYLQAYRARDFQRLENSYLAALQSPRGTLGTFVNDIYGSDWSHISITNVFKCPFERNEVPDIIPAQELDILVQQIEFLKPRVIVAVGTIAQRAIQCIVTSDSVFIALHHPSYLKKIGKYHSAIEDYKQLIRHLLDATQK